jgi:hypothetical protein
VKKKNLNPTWNEEFQFPISSWDLPNILVLHVLDKDFAFFDDSLGSVSYPLICHFLFFIFIFWVCLSAVADCDVDVKYVILDCRVFYPGMCTWDLGAGYCDMHFTWICIIDVWYCGFDA